MRLLLPIILVTLAGCDLFRIPPGDPADPEPQKAPIEKIGEGLKDAGDEMGGSMGALLGILGTAVVIGGGVITKKVMDKDEGRPA